MPPAAEADVRLARLARRLTAIYASAAVVLLALATYRSGAPSQWAARAALVTISLAVSLRCALVWVYRRRPARLNWWLRPTPIVEQEFEITWLLYACLTGAGAILIAIV